MGQQEAIMKRCFAEKRKTCSKCGRELPISHFHKDSAIKDGLQTVCKECRKNVNTVRSDKKFSKVYSNPDLARFTPRQLIDELKQRGYRGTLTIQQQIVL